MKFVKFYVSLICLLAFSQTAFAQATLSVQGVIKNSDGSAVDNGKYGLTFKLYSVSSGGSAVWSETQNNIQVTGGIYSALLGAATPLDAPFNTTYYLGLAVDGGAELVPRTLLTSSPYALSLIGTGNVFPSSGSIGAGTVAPTAGYQLHTNNASGDGKLLVEGSTAAKLDFKKGANTAGISYDGTTISVPGAVSLPGTVTAGTVNATTLTATNFSPANMAVTSKLAVGQSAVDANYALKVNGQMNIAGGGLRISGAIPGYARCTGCKALNSAGLFDMTANSNVTFGGLYLENLVADAQTYYTQSDRRIKTNFVRPLASNELKMLMRIQPTDYQYLDNRRGGRTVKGFIAQEVKEVLPEAIDYATTFIPSIYAAPVSFKTTANALQVETEKAHDLKVGDRVRFYVGEGEMVDLEVATVGNDKIFSVADWTKPTDGLFVYGKQINDFHSIDFNQILALNVSVTQELVRQVEDLKKENASLKTENTQMKASAEKFDARLRALENRLSN